MLQRTNSEDTQYEFWLSKKELASLYYYSVFTPVFMFVLFGYVLFGYVNLENGFGVPEILFTLLLLNFARRAVQIVVCMRRANYYRDRYIIDVEKIQCLSRSQDIVRYTHFWSDLTNIDCGVNFIRDYYRIRDYFFFGESDTVLTFKDGSKRVIYFGNVQSSYEALFVACAMCNGTESLIYREYSDILKVAKTTWEKRMALRNIEIDSIQGAS